MNLAKQKKLDALRAQIAAIQARSSSERGQAAEPDGAPCLSTVEALGEDEALVVDGAITLPDLRKRALGLLARREYAQAELHLRLQAYTANQEMIADLLQDFVARGWVNDLRFAQQYTQSKSAKLGALRLQQVLRQKGVADEIIHQVLSQISLEGEGELARARMVWQKKFAEPALDVKARAKQIRFLQSRGFSLDVIFKVLGAHSDD